jgi:uncharacterized protein (DUF1015 family)
VGLYADETGGAAAALTALVAGPATTVATDDDGVVHRLWVVAAGDDDTDPVRTLVTAAGRGPITIADGHHRYETALRYRDERRMTRSCEEDPAFDYLLMLFLESTGEPLTVLPTHRLLRGLAAGEAEALRGSLERLFDVRPAGREELEQRFGGAPADGGRGLFGLWTRDGGSILTARREAFAARGSSAGPEVRRLDVWLLGTALEELCGIDPAAVSGGERLAYSKSFTEALARVDAAVEGCDAAFLLEPTPVSSIMAVAAAGEVMPQKSTYFYPKALTGLVINPHEW